ncbi:MAG TPA: hypothetical protein DEQ17_02590 [Prevotella sp.]|nr:hypothetical protein [Prevotella sp.]
MSNSRKLLLVEFWIPVFICFCVIILFENDLLLSGGWLENKVQEYYVAIVMELLTIMMIPLSLRLFKFGIVRRQLLLSPIHSLVTWGTLRLCMLAVPMMVNCWLYYMFMNVAFGYMGIICVLCLCFVYPSKARCQMEASGK